MGKPEEFKKSADVVLVLDSGSSYRPIRHYSLCTLRFSAHAVVGKGTLVHRLLLPGYTDEAATAFLEYLYFESRRSNTGSIRNAELVSSPAHKVD